VRIGAMESLDTKKCW